MREELQTMCKTALKMLDKIVEKAEKHNLVDEQWYLNFEDTLNAISCRDHSLYIKASSK